MEIPLSFGTEKISTNSSFNSGSNSNTFFINTVFYPVLPLPANFWDGGFEQSRFGGLFIPAVDPVLSDYGQSALIGAAGKPFYVREAPDINDPIDLLTRGVNLILETYYRLLTC